MGNYYVSTMKDYLRIYYKKHEQLANEIVENNKKFTPEYAESQNAILREKQEKIFEELRFEITDTFREVRQLLAVANFPRVESLSADRLLFQDGGFDFSADDIKGFCERYRDNYTMLRLIQTYINAHNVKNEFSSIHITMPKDILMVYKTFAEGALAVADKIHASEMSGSLELEAFADEDFSKPLFDVIGTGYNLKNSAVDLKKMPESSLHIFDDVSLCEPNAKCYSTIA